MAVFGRNFYYAFQEKPTEQDMRQAKAKVKIAYRVSLQILNNYSEARFIYFILLMKNF